MKAGGNAAPIVTDERFSVEDVTSPKPGVVVPKPVVAIGIASKVGIVNKLNQPTQKPYQT
jgi:hypothetical protein